MILPNDKIRVFISSICGKPKYDLVRAGLENLIESTGLASVYTIESRQASTIPAGQHYRYALEDSDVCIFLIDNKDGISNGVQIEIDTANKHKIKSIYYFCNQKLKRKTPLQKSLTGNKQPLHKTVSSFDMLLSAPAMALMDDIINVYRSYGKGRLIFIDDKEDFNTESLLESVNSLLLETPISKSILSNIDECKDYFSNLIFQQKRKDYSFPNEKIVVNTSSLDIY